MSKANPIFVLSKGRPWCSTARTLVDLDYPGDVLVVCGSDDETVPQYVENFGADMVVVFDHDEWWDKSDMMDAFGRTKPSGIAPVRNFIIHLAREQGYDRCWQFDDDINEFHLNRAAHNDVRVIEDGNELYRELDKMERLARDANIPVVGFSMNQRTWVSPNVLQYNVGGSHNVDTRLRMLYRSRIYEDAVCTQDLLRRGRIQLRFNFLQAKMDGDWYGGSLPKRNAAGGMREQYEMDAGTDTDDDEKRSRLAVTFSGYVCMSLPYARGLKLRRDGSCRSYYDEGRFRPMLLREGYRRGVE